MAVDKSNPNNGPVTGSAIIDGTSYSGADIKVVVHVYDQGSLLEDQATDLETTIGFLQQKVFFLGKNAPSGNATRIDELNDRINLLQDRLAFLRRDLTEFGNIRLSTKVLAEIQTLSVSTYREKYPVRSLSAVYPKGFTRGPRTIGGSMVFTVFDRNVLFDLLEADPSDFDAERIVSSALIDQLPPFDITIAFANELGQTSRMAILAVEMVSEGQVMSIQDLFIENTVQYVARDVDPMTRVGEARFDENNIIVGTQLAPLKGSDLINEEASQKFKQQLDPFAARFRIRSDPFK